MNIQDLVKALNQSFGLNYHVYNKSIEYSLPLSVRLELVDRDRTYRSWGVSENADLAFFKALMEIIERVCIHDNTPIFFKENGLFKQRMLITSIAKNKGLDIGQLCPPTSNGCSISTSLKHAKSGALKELIERHVIISSMLLGVSPMEVDFPISPYKLPNGYKLRFFYWKFESYYVSVCVSIEPSGGFYFGFGCTENLKSSLYRSFEELVPGLIFSMDDSHLKKFGSNIIKDDIQSISRYWRFSGDRRILDFFSAGTGDFSLIKPFKTIHYGSFSIPKYLPKQTNDLFCVRAVSPEAQQLFFDNWDHRYINPNVYSGNKLPLFPHPIA